MAEAMTHAPLAGKTAVVTGSTSGIGLGIVGALAGAGADVMMNGFGEAAEIEALRSSLEAKHGIRAIYSPADMSKPAEIKAMIADAVSGLGGVDILVNNAGIQHVAPIEDFDDEQWDRIIAINLSSSFHTIKHALPGMRDTGWGRVVNVASVHGLSASPYKVGYIAAKHGLIGLTKTVALEAAETGVTVNAICPGYVRTPLVEGQIAEQAESHGIPEEQVIRDVMLARQPTKKFVTVEEVAGMALYLCSDAAGSVTGTALPIDGGWMTL